MYIKGFLNQALNHRSLQFLTWPLLLKEINSGGIVLLCPLQESFLNLKAPIGRQSMIQVFS